MKLGKQDAATVLIELEEIIMQDEERHRQEYTGIAELARSIKLDGQISAIVIDDHNKIIAGGRRLMAFRELAKQDKKFEKIRAVRFSSLNDMQKLQVEFAENEHRKALTPMERLNAVNLAIDAIAKTLKKEPLAVTDKEVHEVLLVPLSAVTSLRNMGKAMKALDEKDPDKVKQIISDRGGSQQKLARAFGKTNAQNSMNEQTAILDAATQEVLAAEAKESGVVQQVKQEILDYDIIHGNYEEIMGKYTGKPFNVLHGDPPYGVGMHTGMQGMANYKDDPAQLQKFMLFVQNNHERFLSSQAHVIHWLAPSTLEYVAGIYKSIGFDIDTNYLYWHKTDGRGVLRNPERFPRNNMEVALFGYRGARHVAKKGVSNVTAFPRGGNELHESPKPLEVMKHFMQLCISNENDSSVLDLTCGSGQALAAARFFGAKRCLGVEIDISHVRTAKNQLAQKNEMLL